MAADSVSSSLQFSLESHGASTAEESAAKSALIDGFPRVVEASAVACVADNINTDGIYPGKYTYNENISHEQQAAGERCLNLGSAC